MFINLLSTYSRYKGVRNPDTCLVPVAYNDANLNYIGRWIDTGSGMWSGWGGSRITFKIRNTGILKFNFTVSDTVTNDNTALVVAVDGNEVATKYLITTTSETYIGTKYVIATIPFDGETHKIDVYMYCLGANQFNVTNQAILNSIEVGFDAVLSPWTLGATKIQCIGDSWMTANASWTRLLDSSVYAVYQTSNTGFKCSDANTNYNNDYTGHTDTSDPTFDKVLISFGVNDYNASVTVGSFQTSLLALIDKVRIRQPDVPIILVRVPNNTGAGLNYGQYLTAMNNAAGLRTDVTVIDTTSIDVSMTWDSDNSHADSYGRLTMRNFVGPLI